MLLNMAREIYMGLGVETEECMDRYNEDWV